MLLNEIYFIPPINRAVDILQSGLPPDQNPSHIIHSVRRETTTTFNSGDIAWMLAATALVISMTIPGLALYYSGLVRVKVIIYFSISVQTFEPFLWFLLRTYWLV